MTSFNPSNSLPSPTRLKPVAQMAASASGGVTAGVACGSGGGGGSGAGTSSGVTALFAHGLETVGAAAATQNPTVNPRLLSAISASSFTQLPDAELADLALENEYQHWKSLVQTVTITCARALRQTPPINANTNEMQKLVESLLKERTQNQQTIQKLEESVGKQQVEIDKMQAELSSEKDRISRAVSDISVQQEERTQIMQTKQKLQSVFKEIESRLKCVSCKEVALLPKAMGCRGGHISCQSCLKEMDNKYYTSAAKANARVRQLIVERCCPSCNDLIVGNGVPVLPLKSTAEVLFTNGFINVSQTVLQKSLYLGQIAYEPRSPEQIYYEALQIGGKAQIDLAVFALNRVLAIVTKEQWSKGVYILFEPAPTSIFFQHFALSLHSRADNINVRVNINERMLACQIIAAYRYETLQSIDYKILHLQKAIEDLTQYANLIPVTANHANKIQLRATLVFQINQAVNVLYAISRKTPSPTPQEINAAVEQANIALQTSQKAFQSTLLELQLLPEKSLLIKIAHDGNIIISQTDPAPAFAAAAASGSVSQPPPVPPQPHGHSHAVNGSAAMPPPPPRAPRVPTLMHAAAAASASGAAAAAANGVDSEAAKLANAQRSTVFGNALSAINAGAAVTPARVVVAAAAAAANGAAAIPPPPLPIPAPRQPQHPQRPAASASVGVGAGAAGAGVAAAAAAAAAAGSSSAANAKQPEGKK